jgi:hypothetical protein
VEEPIRKEALEDLVEELLEEEILDVTEFIRLDNK